MAYRIQTILAVDDEEEILEAIAVILEEAGYDILLATSASEALEILESHRAVDLLLTDIVMPGKLDGFGLADRARSMQPRLPVVFMSGYIERLPSAPHNIATSLIAKPWLAAELSAGVERALAAGSLH